MFVSSSVVAQAVQHFEDGLLWLVTELAWTADCASPVDLPLSKDAQAI